jgi:hypothetical protein
MARACDQLVDADIELLLRVVRMGADRAIDVGKALGDGEHLRVPLDAGRDSDDARNAGGACARDDAVEFAGKVGKIEVAVAVDQHVRKGEFLGSCREMARRLPMIHPVR